MGTYQKRWGYTLSICNVPICVCVFIRRPRPTQVGARQGIGASNPVTTTFISADPGWRKGERVNDYRFVLVQQQQQQQQQPLRVSTDSDDTLSLFCALRVSRDSDDAWNIFSRDVDDFSARNYVLFRCGQGSDMEAWELQFGGRQQQQQQQQNLRIVFYGFRRHVRAFTGMVFPARGSLVLGCRVLFSVCFLEPCWQRRF